TASQIGERRALQGVPIDAVIQSWMALQRNVVEYVAENAAGLRREDLSIALSHLGETFANLTRTTVDTYRRTQSEVMAHFDRMTGDLVGRVAGGQPIDVDDITRRARYLGLDPTQHYLPVMAFVRYRGVSSLPEAQVRLQRHFLGAIVPRGA